MNIQRFTSALVFSASLLSIPAFAQASVSTDPEVTDYLAAKDQEFAATRSALRGSPSFPYITALEQLVRDRKSVDMNGVRGKTTEDRAKVTDALTETLALFLASLGYTPSSLNEAERKGGDVVNAAREAVLGQGSLSAYKAVSPIVLLAQLKSLNTDPSDPLGFVATFATLKLFKGEVPNEFQIRLRRPSATANSEIGEQIVLFLSSDLANFRKSLNSRDKLHAQGNFAEDFAPYKVANGQLRTTTFGQDTVESRPLSDLE